MNAMLRHPLEFPELPTIILELLIYLQFVWVLLIIFECIVRVELIILFPPFLE